MANTHPNPDAMSAQYVHWFRNSAPYINAHRGKIFVLMFGGEAVNHDNFKNIIHDIALLHSLGIKLILVHGARPQIDENLRENGIQTPFHNDLRITTRESLRCVMDAVGSIRLEIEALLSMGLANSPMYGARIDAVSGNFITARPYGVRAGIDHQLTGEVRSVDVVAVQKNLDNHHIVILGPTGYSTTGEVFNLLAEEVAVKTATAIKADKLIFLGEQGGVPHNFKQQLLKELIPNEVDQYLDGKDLDIEMHMHLRGAADACRGGVRRAHIISYTSDGAMLQELFTRDGSGTLVSQDYYEEIRQANIDDVVGLLELLSPLEEEGILVRRERERLETEVDHFVVVERDGMIVGCSALYPIAMQRGELPAAEIACIAVHANYRGSDRGGLMLNFLEAKAKKKGIKEVFVLTTRTSHWFLDHGFEQVEVDHLPAERKQMYNFQRNSFVFRKLLQV